MLGLALAAALAHATPVGVTVLPYSDPARQAWTGDAARPVQVLLWYPAAAGTVERNWQVGPFAPQRVAWDAPAEDGPPRPLVLLSHGTGGAAPTLGWLARALAAAGYVIAAVNHHGNTAAEPAYALEGFLAWWERPLDLKVALDRLLADPRWAARLDAGRVGAAGFSIGGTTVLATAGVRPDVARWRAGCDAKSRQPGCTLPPEASRWSDEEARALLADARRFGPTLARAAGDLREPRVRAVFALAPVLSGAVVPASLADVQVPVQIVSGEADDQALPAGVRAWGRIPGASVDLLPGVTHYAFLAPCTFWARLYAGTICRDPGGLDRGALHAATAARARAFFDRQLAPR